MYIFIALGWNLKLNPNYRVTTAPNTKAEVVSPGVEHTLVPTKRDHAFFGVGGPLGCWFVGGVGCSAIRLAAQLGVLLVRLLTKTSSIK